MDGADFDLEQRSPTPGDRYTHDCFDDDDDDDDSFDRQQHRMMNDPNQIYYAEEASLYSIAEDSREDRQSEYTPTRNSHAGGGGGTSSANLGGGQRCGRRGNDNNDDEDELFGVELCLDDELTKASDDQFRHYTHADRRRCCIAAVSCLICCALLCALILSVTLTQLSERNSRHNSSSKAVVAATANDVPSDTVVSTTSAPATSTSNANNGGGTGNSTQQATTALPSLSPAQSPTVDANYLLSQNHVYSALSPCQSSSSLVEPATPQGRIFASLVQEVYSSAIRNDTTGEISLNGDSSGTDYLREKYALEMLYTSTNGDGWTSSSGWMKPSDPCTWFGVQCPTARIGGACAVTNLQLGKVAFFMCSFFLPIVNTPKLIITRTKVRCCPDKLLTFCYPYSS
jgi:hypothetical protein